MYFLIKICLPSFFEISVIGRFSVYLDTFIESEYCKSGTFNDFSTIIVLTIMAIEELSEISKMVILLRLSKVKKTQLEGTAEFYWMKYILPENSMMIAY